MYESTSVLIECAATMDGLWIHYSRSFTKAMGLMHEIVEWKISVSKCRLFHLLCDVFVWISTSPLVRSCHGHHWPSLLSYSCSANTRNDGGILAFAESSFPWIADLQMHAVQGTPLGNLAERRGELVLRERRRERYR